MWFPTVAVTVETETLSKTLQAKLAYYQGFHQQSHELLIDIMEQSEKFELWEEYLICSALLQEYDDAYDSITKAGESFPNALRNYYHAFAMLSQKPMLLQETDQDLQWQEVFHYIPLEDQHQLISDFHQSEFMQWPQPRSFMMAYLSMYGYDLVAQSLLFLPIEQFDEQYSMEVAQIFPPEILSLYLEFLTKNQSKYPQGALKHIVAQSSYPFDYSEMTQKNLASHINSISDYYLLLKNGHGKLLRDLSTLKSSAEKEKIVAIQAIFNSDYKKASELLAKKDSVWSKSELEFLHYSLLTHAQIYHEVDISFDAKDLEDQQLRDLKLDLLVKSHPDKALYLFRNEQLFTHWQDQAYWEAVAYAQKSHFDKSLTMLNYLIMVKPFDQNIRSLLTKVMIEHYQDYTIAENLMLLDGSESNESKSLQALIAMGRADREKALELSYQVLKSKTSFSVTCRTLKVLKHYNQLEDLETYKSRFLKNCPKNWHETIERMLAEQGI